MATLGGLRLLPTYHERVWGGQRLRPGDAPIGEAWIVYEHNRVADGPLAGQTLAEVTAAHGEELLGSKVVAQSGLRFPLLIKLLDTLDWLSVQVHPNDQQAVALEGPGHLGKTEAWHILDAAPGAQLICGLRPGTTREALAAAIRTGTVTDLSSYLTVEAGDTVMVRAGMIHALGPGLLLYEVQQTSDITYRVFDWNRPAAAGRALHIEQSLAVSDPTLTGEIRPRPATTSGSPQMLVTCPYFTLSEVVGGVTARKLDTGGESFHILTVIEGEAQVAGEGWQQNLTRFESVVVPAACGTYQVTGSAGSRILQASGT